MSRGKSTTMPDTRPIFLVDCDGPLADLCHLWYKRHNQTCRICTEPLTPEKVVSWDTHKYVACGKHIYSYLETDMTIWRYARTIPGAKRILRRMSEYVRPVVVTTVTAGPQARLYRVEWIRRHFPFINPLDIVITKEKTCVRGDIILDDAPHNLVNHTAERLVLDYPWNRDFSDALRVFNWDDVEARVREYLELGVPDGQRRDLRPSERGGAGR